MLLRGLKVVDMSNWVAAPSCAMILGEWGADVVKIESPAGDPMRAIFPDTPESPANPVFSLSNRGKRGVILDTARVEGREALCRLLDTADVFITNVRPGALRRAGLDYGSLRRRCPRLIYASVSGYGLQGEASDRAAFDQTAFWARGGVLASHLPPDQEPFPGRPGFGDHFASMTVLSGVLAALYHRERANEGQLVEVSLMRAATFALGWDVSVQLRYGEAVTNLSRRDRPAAMVGYFRTRDHRWLYVGQRSPNCLAAFLTVLGLEGLLEEARLAAASPDMGLTRKLRAQFDDVFATLSLQEAGARLDAADLIWGPLARLPEVVEDPYAHAAGCFVEASDGRGGAFLSAASPVRFSSAEIGPHQAAPRFGQHTCEVLSEAGVSAQELGRLLRDGAAYQEDADP